MARSRRRQAEVFVIVILTAITSGFVARVVSPGNTIKIDRLVLHMSRSNADAVQNCLHRKPHEAKRGSIWYFEGHAVECLNVGPEVKFNDSGVTRIAGGELEFKGQVFRIGTKADALLSFLGEPDRDEPAPGGNPGDDFHDRRFLYYRALKLQISVGDYRRNKATLCGSFVLDSEL